MPRGFSLIETIIYVLIIGLVMGTFGMFITNLLQARAKTIAASDVITAARTIQDRLTSAARHAEGINVASSTFGSDPGVLSFDMVEASVDPTIFSLTGDNGQVQVREASGAAQLLTSDDVAITDFVFTNLTGAEDIGIIQAQFTVEAVNPSGSPYFDYVETFQTTLRIPLD